MMAHYISHAHKRAQRNVPLVDYIICKFVNRKKCMNHKCCAGGWHILLQQQSYSSNQTNSSRTCLAIKASIEAIVTRTELEPVKPTGPTGFEPRPVQTGPLNRFRPVPYGTGFFGLNRPVPYGTGFFCQ